MTEAGLMLIESAVVRAACAERTERDLQALEESSEQACGLPAGVAWERKAAAHAEFHNLLADATGNPVLSILVRSMTETLRDIMVLAGPAAEGTIIGSRCRLLRHLRARDEENAAAEMEDHLARLDGSSVIFPGSPRLDAPNRTAPGDYRGHFCTLPLTPLPAVGA